MDQSRNDKAICRTALATLGLLNTIKPIKRTDLERKEKKSCSCKVLENEKEINARGGGHVENVQK